MYWGTGALGVGGHKAQEEGVVAVVWLGRWVSGSSRTCVHMKCMGIWVFPGAVGVVRVCQGGRVTVILEAALGQRMFSNEKLYKC